MNDNQPCQSELKEEMIQNSTQPAVRIPAVPFHKDLRALF